MNTLADSKYYLDILRKQLNSKVDLREKRPGIFQLIAPFFHEDGDMVDVYLERSKESPNKIRITDYGKTIMRLSYTFDIDTPKRAEVFNLIISESSIYEDSGQLYIEVHPETLTAGIYQFTQAIAKISSMRHFSRETIRSMFYEDLRHYILSDLTKYQPTPRVTPIVDREDLEVDYVFPIAKRPLFLFGVRGYSKSRLVTICCLEFQKANLPFRSVIVHEDLDSLPKNDRYRITNIADKQFIGIEDFKRHGPSFFDREVS